MITYDKGISQQLRRVEVQSCAMRRVIAVVLLAVATGAAQVSTQGQPYKNVESGISYQPPGGWNVEQRGEGGAFSALFTSPDSRSRVIIMVLSKALYADATVENALPPSDAGRKFHKLKAPKAFPAAGFSFARADFQEEHQPVYQSRLMTDAGSWRILIIASAPSQHDVDGLLATLSTFAFAPPEPVKVLTADRVLVDAAEMQKTLIKTVMPQFPNRGSAHPKGTVHLRVIIGRDGKVKNVDVVDGDALLSKVAVDAVKQWEWRPYYYKGQPIEVETRVTVNFS